MQNWVPHFLESRPRLRPCIFQHMYETNSAGSVIFTLLNDALHFWRMGHSPGMAPLNLRFGLTMEFA